jgi:hypothetical protein
MREALTAVRNASHTRCTALTPTATTFKWIRILYRCWVDRVPYDESKYLMALQKR